jgi:predicted alpha/beta superfamily hydrolase
MSPSAAGTPPPVIIPGTERHELRSSHTGRVYNVSIGLPEGYDDTDGLFPVVYVLDGQWDFKLVMSVYGALNFDMYVPDAIVVGIAAGGDDPDHEALRVRDYTPTARTVEDSGDAERFFAFFSKELMPFVAQHYRIDQGDRTLVGSSRGGLFVLYVMFTEPEMFNRLVALNPAIVWDEVAVTTWEEQFARNHRDLSVRLYLAAGELEPSLAFLDPLDRLSDRLRTRDYGGLQLAHVVIPGERHSGVKAEAFNRGLRWVFAKPIVDLPVSVLQSYAGEYRQDDAERLPSGPAVHNLSHLLIRVEGERLIVDGESGFPDGEELVPTAADEFTFAGSIPGVARFHRDAPDGTERLSIVSSPLLADGTITLDRVR